MFWFWKILNAMAVYSVIRLGFVYVPMVWTMNPLDSVLLALVISIIGLEWILDLLDMNNADY